MRHTALSLFCGAGGCSLGFQRAGYEILFASDIDKAAIDTYKANFPASSCIQSDIRKTDFSQILLDLGLIVGELDILMALHVKDFLPQVFGFGTTPEIRCSNNIFMLSTPSNLNGF
jgi:C-5 cytosine-specific DNA methylase